MVNGKIGGAVIGCGGMGSWHAEKMSYYMKDRMELVGIWDINPEKCEEAEERGWHTFSSQEELLADSRIDFVVVATPNDCHHDIVIAALEAGKNVMSEKPVTMTSELLDDMIKASERTGKFFTVHQNRRYDADYLTVKRIYDENLLGNIFRIESRVSGSRGIPGDWRQLKAKGGGMILDWGIHILDQALMMFDNKELDSVYCRVTHVTNDEVDDGFFASLMYKDGSVYEIADCTSNFIDYPRWRVQGINGTAICEWDLSGKMVLVYDWENKDAVPVRMGVGLTKTMAPRTDDSIKTIPLPVVEDKGFSGEHTLYNNICDVIEGKAEPIVTLNQQRRLIKVVEALFESAEKNAVVKL